MDRNHAPPVAPDDPLSPASDCSMRSRTKSPTMEPTSKAKPPEKPFLPSAPKESRKEWEQRKRKEKEWEQKVWMEAEDRPGLQKPITQSEMQDIKRWSESFIRNETPEPETPEKTRKFMQVLSLAIGKYDVDETQTTPKKQMKLQCGV